MKKRSGDTTFVLLLLLVILIAGGFFYWKYRQDGGTPVFELLKEAEVEPVKTDYQSLIRNFDETGKVEGKIHVGDYVSYTPKGESSYPLGKSNTGADLSQTVERDTNLKWRVLGLSKDKTQLILISDKPADGDYVTFKGIDGYNNIVYVLNDICDTLYSNPELGIARSIKLEDVQAYFSPDFDFASYDNGVTKYGETMEYTLEDTMRYPAIFEKETGQTIDGKEGKGLTASEQKNIMNGAKKASQNLTVKQTFRKKELQASDFILPIYYELFMSSEKEYYLATRCTDTTKEYPKFGEMRIRSGLVSGDALYFKPGEVMNMSYLRPVVELEMNLKVDMMNKDSSGTETNPWVLEPATSTSTIQS